MFDIDIIYESKISLLCILTLFIFSCIRVQKKELYEDTTLFLTNNLGSLEDDKNHGYSTQYHNKLSVSIGQYGGNNSMIVLTLSEWLLLIGTIMLVIRTMVALADYWRKHNS